MALCYVVLYGVVFMWLLSVHQKREGNLSSVAVFGVMALVYYIGVPFEMWIRGVDRVFDGESDVFFTVKQIETILLMATVAIVSFFAGYKISRFDPGMFDKHYKHEVQPMPGGIVLIIFVCSTIIATMYREQLLSLSDYRVQMSIMYNAPFFSYLTYLLLVCVALIARINASRFQDGRQHKIVFLFLVACMLFWSIYGKRKDGFVFAILAAIPLQGKRIPVVSLVLIMVPFAFICILLTIYFSAMRGNSTYSIFEFMDLSYLTLTMSEPTGPLNALSFLLNHDGVPLFGLSYLDSVILLLPKALYSERPMGIADEFAKMFASNWSEGKGFGYSLMAEAYANFGWLGVPMQYFTIGFFWGKGWKIIFRLMSRIGLDETASKSLYFTLGYFALLTMHRSPVSTSFKFILMCSVPIMIMSLFCNRVRSALRSNV